MKLSTRARYAARFMLDMAIHNGNGYISLKDVAERQDISWKYLWNLIGPLKTSGLIRSARGAKGGYIIAKPLDKITLKDIVNAVEGPLCLVDCVENAAFCNRSKDCITREVWIETSEKIQQVLGDITLDDMVHRYSRAKL